ncbi:hypothetical protein BaRGS_00032591 [Batillaria attramentaria]|uniref:Uncharacterized protein n=1 Tax=Batillaria attramentaria TaxID=370345 RepID=A0ABD0JMI2_9CAEN
MSPDCLNTGTRPGLAGGVSSEWVVTLEIDQTYNSKLCVAMEHRSSRELAVLGSVYTPPLTRAACKLVCGVSTEASHYTTLPRRRSNSSSRNARASWPVPERGWHVTGRRVALSFKGSRHSSVNLFGSLALPRRRLYQT